MDAEINDSPRLCSNILARFHYNMQTIRTLLQPLHIPTSAFCPFKYNCSYHSNHINITSRTANTHCCEATKASQQTNFSRMHDQPELPVSDARLIWKILDVCISLHLPRFQVIEIEALPIHKNFYHQGSSSGVDMEEKILFHVESYVFVGERVWK